MKSEHAGAMLSTINCAQVPEPETISGYGWLVYGRSFEDCITSVDLKTLYRLDDLIRNSILENHFEQELSKGLSIGTTGAVLHSCWEFFLSKVSLPVSASPNLRSLMIIERPA
jgi:hypothetical protein